MEICLVRHAIAVERGTSGYQDDRARPLTPDGRTRMKAAARGLKQLFAPQLILTSPVLRAKQTAEILEDVFRVPVIEVEALGRGDHAETLKQLAGPDSARTALVGHEPWMSELLSVMVAGDAGTMLSVFKKGAAALVTSDRAPEAGRCVLQWLLQPAALRRLG